MTIKLLTINTISLMNNLESMSLMLNYIAQKANLSINLKGRIITLHSFGFICKFVNVPTLGLIGVF